MVLGIYSRIKRNGIFANDYFYADLFDRYYHNEKYIDDDDQPSDTSMAKKITLKCLKFILSVAIANLIRN